MYVEWSIFAAFHLIEYEFFVPFAENFEDFINFGKFWVATMFDAANELLNTHIHSKV